jgi:hypothetical protein
LSPARAVLATEPGIARFDIALAMPAPATHLFEVAVTVHADAGSTGRVSNAGLVAGSLRDLRVRAQRARRRGDGRLRARRSK